MAKKLEALQRLSAVKTAQPGRCSTTCLFVQDFASHIIVF